MNKFFILFSLIIFLGIFGFIVYREGTLPVDKNNKTTKIFVINKGESLNEIANKLAVEGLIRNRLVFYLLIKQRGLEKKIQAGDFRLSPSMDIFTLTKTMQHGTLDIWITVIEGLRKEEIAQIIAKNLNIPEIEIISLAKEGYLFPDTYLIPTTATAETVISIMKNNFEKKFDAKLQAQAKRKNLTEKQVLILASLVEREARQPATRQKVASIILKRYLEDWPLQIDATVQYVLGYQALEKSWWKKELLTEDLKIESPFNTYKNKGLPPEPICNPSLSSIEAVVNADVKTPYWYYITDKNGVMHYAVTLEEHEANIKKYLN